MNSKEIGYWRQLADDLGIVVVAPFHLDFSDGSRLVANALIRDFGGKLGLVADDDSAVLVPFFKRLPELGYCFSCVTIGPAKSYWRDSTLELLADWTWTGSPESRPLWLLNFRGESQRV